MRFGKLSNQPTRRARFETANFASLENWYLVANGFPVYSENTPASVCNVSGSTSVTFTSRHQFVGQGSWIRLVYGFYTASGVIGEVSLSNPVTIEASWQGLGGTPVRVTFNNGNITVTGQYAVAVSDPIYFPYNNGYWGWALTNLSVTDPSFKIPGGWKGISDPTRENRGLGEGCINGNLVMSGQSSVGTKASAGDRMFGPLAILGYYPEGTTPPQSLFLQGDSHQAATNDEILGRNVGSFGVRWCLQQFNGTIDLSVGLRAPYVIMAKGGESSRQFLDNSSVVRAAMRNYVTDVMLQCSNHDAENGADATTWKNTLKELVNWASCGKNVKRIYLTTAFPKDTSTDGFATAYNQTVIASASRVTVNDWIRNTSTGLMSEASKLISGGQSLTPLDITAAFEVDATNTITTNGGRFLVGDLTPDYSGTVVNLTGANTNRVRTSITSPPIGELQNYIIRFTSGANNGEARNIEYDVLRTDGSREIDWSPALQYTPSIGDTIEVYSVDSGTWKGNPSDGGIHGLKNIHGRIAYYLDSLNLISLKNVTPYTVVVPIGDFDPLEWGTPTRIYDFSAPGTMYTDTTKTTLVQNSGDLIGDIDGSTINGTKYGTDLTQTQIGVGTVREKRPTWVFSTGIGSAIFDGVDDFLAQSTGIGTQPTTKIAVCSLISKPASGSSFLFDGFGNSTSRQRLSASSASVPARQINAGTAMGAGSWTQGSTVVVASVFNSVSGNSACYVNGNSVGVGTNAGTQSAVGLIFGGDRTNAMTNTAGSNCCNMSLIYYIEYSVALASTQISTLSAQLQNEYIQ